jgi:hypothetical protein
MGERPNGTTVGGAGLERKTFVQTKACTAPHPLQPILRPHSHSLRQRYKR